MPVIFPTLDSIALKSFLLRLFATIGVVLSLMVLGLYLGIRHWTKTPVAEPKAPESMVLALDFKAPIGERPNDFSLNMFVNGEQETPLYTIIDAITKAKTDKRVKGIIARFSAAQKPSLAQAQEIATALQSFRESGKFTLSYAPSYGSFGKGSSIMLLASQFEERWMQPIGSVALSTLSMETPFGQSALKKLGITTDFMRRAEYKSVMENVSRDSYSAPVKANMESMIASLQSEIVSGLASGMKITQEQALTLMEQGPYTQSEALNAHLVTQIGYADEADKHLDDLAGKDSQTIPPSTYLYYADKDQSEKKKTQIALIYANGLITDEPSHGPSRLAEKETIDTDEVVSAFEEAKKNPKIKAILFRVNSPGGSPVASETMRRAVLRAKEAGKKVYVSMGDVAASGGYWISMDADYIVANPTTITGSIGVIAGKFVFGELFDKVGVKWDGVGDKNKAALWSIRQPFGKAERERMNAMLDETYGAFTSHVANARKIPLKEIEKVAKGRVFTGTTAKDVGLVDELGGMETTLAAIKRDLKLDEETELDLRLLPARETMRSALLQALQDFAGSAMFFSSRQGQFISRAITTIIPISTNMASFLNEIEEQGAIRATLPASFQNQNW